MNSRKYLQTDSAWGGLPYPKAPWYIRNCGCGLVAVLHAIIETPKYKNYTPATIQPYMKRFAESRGNGTYHYGIPEALRHYGCTEVREHATMASLWRELERGKDYIVVYLMGSERGGSKGVKWTGCGHFVESCDYEKKNGKRYVYMKDSASNSKLRNGKISYEENFRGSVLKVWSGKLPSRVNMVTVPGALLVDGIGGTNTVKATQKYFKTSVNGKIAGQSPKQSQFYPALTAVTFQKRKKNQGNDPTVMALQKWVGVKEIDGVLGKGTIAAWQKKLKDLKYYTGIIDGYFGVVSMMAWQEFLNDKLFGVNTKKSTTTSNSNTKKSSGGKSEKTSENATQKRIDKMMAWTKDICNDPAFHYVNWDGSQKAKECPICHKHAKGKYYGCNCIGFVAAALHHGAELKDIKCANNGFLGGNDNYTYLLKHSYDDAQAFVDKKLGKGRFKLIRDGGKTLSGSKLKKGDIVIYYKNNEFWHIGIFYGKVDGKYKIRDCTSSVKTSPSRRNYTLSYPCKVALRYVGK